MKHYWFQPLCIPFTLLTYVAQALLLFFYKPSRWRGRQGCIECVDSTPDSTSTTIWGRPGGQSLGIRWIFFNTTLGRDWKPLGVHERVHTLHGEWVNTAAHLILVPPAVILAPELGDVFIYAAVLLGQLAFGISYGGHFMWEWAKLGFKKSRWRDAYIRIWTERYAYRVGAEYEKGDRPDAWGG